MKCLSCFLFIFSESFSRIFSSLFVAFLLDIATYSSNFRLKECLCRAEGFIFGFSPMLFRPELSSIVVRYGMIFLNDYPAPHDGHPWPFSSPVFTSFSKDESPNGRLIFIILHRRFMSSDFLPPGTRRSGVVDNYWCWFHSFPFYLIPTLNTSKNLIFQTWTATS